MQPSQLNWSFPDFPPVPLLKPEILKLTTILKIEIEISILIEKRYLIFSMHIAGHHVPCIALQLTWNRLVSNY